MGFDTRECRGTEVPRGIRSPIGGPGPYVPELVRISNAQETEAGLPHETELT